MCVAQSFLSVRAVHECSIKPHALYFPGHLNVDSQVFSKMVDSVKDCKKNSNCVVYESVQYMHLCWTGSCSLYHVQCCTYIICCGWIVFDKRIHEQSWHLNMRYVYISLLHIWQCVFVKILILM